MAVGKDCIPDTGCYKQDEGDQHQLEVGLLTKPNLVEAAYQEQKEDQDSCYDPAKDNQEGAKDVHLLYASAVENERPCLVLILSVESQPCREAGDKVSPR
jgi:hypothetical protein